MNRNNNILLKTFLLLMLAVGWGGSAIAARLNPTFDTSETAFTTSHWYYVTFVNKGTNQKAFARTSDSKFRYDTATPNNNYRWRFIGTATDFVLQSATGYYVYTTASGTGRETEYQVTTNASSATHFKMVNGTDANSWGFQRISNGGTTDNFLNPRSGDVKEWSNDGGSRIQLAATEIEVKSYRVNIISSDGIDVSSYRVKYNNAEYPSGSEFAIVPPATMDGTTFQTTCNDKFVWGPVVDETAMTVTFDVRSTATSLTAGKFYQMVLRDKSGQVYNGSVQSKTSMVGAVNEFNTIRHKGQYIYAITAGDTGWTVELTGIYNTVKESATYIYVDAVNGNNVSMRMQNGQHVNQNGQGVSSGTVPFVYQSSTGAFKWNSNALPWNNLRNSKVGIGNTGNASSGNMEFFFHELNLVEYTLAAVDEEGNAIPVPGITYRNDDGLAMDGKLYIPSSRTSFSASDFTAVKNTIQNISVSGSTITLTLSVPNILHRQSHLFTKLNSTADDMLPGQGFIKKGEGMTRNPFMSDVEIQYMSNYTITQYIKHGQARNLYMPTIDNGNTEVTAYQRWYDYQHESLPRTDVIDVAALRQNAYLYKNGVVVGSNNSCGDVIKTAAANLPAGLDEYWLAVDQSRYNDGSINNSTKNLTEPSLTLRVIYHLIDAKQMAAKLSACTSTSGKWLEEHNIAYPNKKLWNGQSATKSGVDYVGLEHEFANYWCFDGNGTTDANLVQMASGKLVAELDASSTAQLTNIGILVNNHGGSGIGSVRSGGEWGRNRFIAFQYPQVNGKYEVPENSFAIINVYMQHGSNKYQLAKIRLSFVAGAEPLLLDEVFGVNENGEYKNSRSKEAMTAAYGNPVSELTFDHAAFNAFSCPNGTKADAYAFPLDFKQSSYGYHCAPWASRGEYAFRYGGDNIGQKMFYPVDSYKEAIKNNTSLAAQTGKYFLYVDASEQPGQVMSIPIPEKLCAGSRMYCYGWFNSATQIGQQSVGIVLNVVGKLNENDEKGEIIYSYNPGLLSTKAFNSNNEIVETILGAAPWRQVGFSFLIDGANADRYAAYELQVMNNCYSTDGGDFTLDNFYIFVNPPKGNVDFTTPLCSDKVRHAKIHADYDMIKTTSGKNETEASDDPNFYVTCCFLEASVFDSYEKDGLKISEIFDIDSKGNHFLKPEYADTEEKLEKSEALINEAFGVALVGSRHLSDADSEAHGFHVYTIKPVYTDIDPYLYNDSKSDAVYRERGNDGVNRIVFKEDVVRGDMEMLPDGRYPHMRPSTEYYLVFSTIKASQSMIDHHSTATDIFHIHESCSFFGKFTTKDPMHVILDNADIEADIPVRAVCHGEETTFSFDMPAMKLNKPIFDEAYCTSDEDLHEQMVPSTHGANHYKYEPKLNEPEVIAVIRDLPYDWWFGGTLKGSWGEKKYRGTIDEYKSATHPSITYSGPQDIAHKQDNAPVNIAQAMTDFRFYYPEFGKGISDWKNLDWSGVTRKEYNHDTGYGLLDSEIATIRDFVEAGIITLYRDSYEKPMTYDEADQLIEKELSDMMESEMNAQILNLALTLDDDPAIAATLPLKKLEATVLDKLSPEGRKSLTIEELGNLTHDNLKAVAEKLRSSGKLKLSSEKINSLSQNLLFNFVEPVLKAMDEDELRTFAKTYFPDLGHVKRAYLVVRALDILSRETVAALTPEEQQNTATVRTKLREKMIEVFSEQSADVLKKMIHDVTAKLSMDEREALLKDKDLDNMSQAELAVVVEDGLAIITDNSLRDLRADRYLHFTLIPIMPSQENFVDEPYIFCPEPRGVRIRLTTHEPVMLDGFADMSYPEDMKNVPVRLGLPQINKTKAGQNKTLRIPVRGMKKAAKDGIVAVKLTDTGYQNYLFLAKTDDPQYMQSGASADTDGLTEAKNLEGVYAKMVGTVEKMVAVYPTDEDKTPINYIDVLFASDMKFREGYTYRVGVNFMEKNADDQPTISCYGTMLFDMKIVPEYQKWTAAEGTVEWTNDGNWVRADRNKLNADNTATGDVIDGSTDITSSDNYPTNAVNATSKSFVPMYFTNVLIDKDADAPVLYEGLTAASRSQKKFLAGLKSTATERIIYDMEVYPSTGAWHAEGNHECGLFGTYVANGITFLPAAQLFNAHLLDYKKAWVEYELTSNRWYTLASPLQNTFAGEWYAPTAGARQQTPHFYGINYSHDLNHRFQPAIYQRSWDSKGNNPVYLKQGGVQEAYIKADWSYVYNDVTKEYSQGGFSVKVSDELMESAPVSGKALIRMPKADTKYTYYDLNNQTGAKPDDVLNVNNNRYHLWSDKLKEAESFTQTITNVTSDNNFFLVGNPFMAKMDMDQFFAVNDHLEKKFWIMTEDGQEVSVKVDGENGKWIATNGTIGKVAPLQGFFVKGSGNTTTLTFTADMQAPDDALASGDTPVLRAKTTRSSAQQGNEVIRLIAERDGAKSTALIVLGDNADDSYVATEDCEVFIDGNVYDLPTVYTSSASVAQTINVRSSLEMVPVGIISSDDSETVLRFDLSESSSESVYLYDSLTNQYEKISDGAEVLMSGNNSGRYFLSKATTGINNLTVDRDTVRKGVYTLSGKYCGTKVQGLAPGIYVVDGVKMHVK